jgi:hypothetical protein
MVLSLDLNNPFDIDELQAVHSIEGMISEIEDNLGVPFNEFL